MNRERIAVLASGGVDSNILIGRYLRRYVVFPVYVRCGFVWEAAEIFWLRRYLTALRSRHLKPLTLLDVPVGDLAKGHWGLTGRHVPTPRSADKSVALPGRNLLLLSKVALFCAIRKIPLIAIGSISEGLFPDASKEFFRDFSRVASRALSFKIKIVSPFLGRDKKWVFRRGRGFPLQLSFSCLSPKGLAACRRCYKCAERETVLQ